MPALLSIKNAALAMKWLMRGAIAIGIILIILAILLHTVLVPNINKFRPQLENILSKEIGARVKIDEITAKSTGLVPSIELDNIKILPKDENDNNAGLLIPRSIIAFSALSIIRGGLEQLIIEAPQLEIKRNKDGKISIASLDISEQNAPEADSTAALDWIFSQPEFILKHGVIKWTDEYNIENNHEEIVPSLLLGNVEFSVINNSSKHNINLKAIPLSDEGNKTWGLPFELIAKFTSPRFGNKGDISKWEGTIYADFKEINIGAISPYLNKILKSLDINIKNGIGAMRTWIDINKNKIESITTDTKLNNIKVQLDKKLSALEFKPLSGRLNWQDNLQKTSFSTENLKFENNVGLNWNNGNVKISINKRNKKGEINARSLDLEALSKIANSLPLPDKTNEMLTNYPVSGIIENINASWSGEIESPQTWKIDGDINNLSIGEHINKANTASKNTEIKNLSANFTATNEGGNLTANIKNGYLSLPDVFENPKVQINKANAQINWQIEKSGHIKANLKELIIVNDDVSGKFTAKWQTNNQSGKDKFPGIIDLNGIFDKANGAKIYKYLPLEVEADARRYVQLAIKSGDARDIKVKIKGDLNHVADIKPPAGTVFSFGGKINNAVFAFVPNEINTENAKRRGEKNIIQWPALTNVSGDLLFSHASMKLTNAKAKVDGFNNWQFSNIKVDIENLAKTVVQVDAKGNGAISDVISIIKKSPLSDMTQNALNNVKADGQSKLSLKLSLPVEDIDNSKVLGNIELNNNKLDIDSDAPQLLNANGNILFSEKGFELKNIKANTLGGNALISGGMNSSKKESQSPRIKVIGTASASELAKMRQWSPVAEISSFANGSADYEANLLFAKSGTDILVKTDLKDMNIKLPAPFSKSAGQILPLEYESKFENNKKIISAKLSPAAGSSTFIKYEVKNDKVERGLWSVDKTPANILPDSGVVANIDINTLDGDKWEDAIDKIVKLMPDSGDSDGNDFLPAKYNFNIANLLISGRSFSNVIIRGVQKNNTWQLSANSPQIKGNITFTPQIKKQPARVIARLDYLKIPAISIKEENKKPDNLANPPQADIKVKELEYEGVKIGEFDINSKLAGKSWIIDSLKIRNKNANITASGDYSNGQTNLDINIKISDAGKLLSSFNMPDEIARGNGSLKGSIQWAGLPYSPQINTLNGQWNINISNGQFVQVKAGMAKLVGIISLQNLPRRFALDFKDIFAKGFAFDFLRGDIEFEKGIASTQNLQIKGASAAVLIEGQANLQEQTQDIDAWIIPKIDAGSAALLAGVINPAIGIGAFVAQLVLQAPLNKAATRHLHITGTWKSPQVETVEGEQKKQAPKKGLEEIELPNVDDSIEDESDGALIYDF